jgi:hypothetical protein
MVRIQAGKPAILTDVLCVFSYFRQIMRQYFKKATAAQFQTHSDSPSIR